MEREQKISGLLQEGGEIIGVWCVALCVMVPMVL